MKEGEGISQRSYTAEVMGRTTVWCWPEGREDVGWEEGSQRSGGDGDICNSINN